MMVMLGVQVLPRFVQEANGEWKEHAGARVTLSDGTSFVNVKNEHPNLEPPQVLAAAVFPLVVAAAD